MKNNCCFLSYYTKADSHIINMVKIVLDVTDHATTNELEHATGFDTSDLAAKTFCYFES